MSGKRKKGAGKAAPRAYGRLTRHERDTVQRMLERGASCRQIARELGRSPSTVCSEVACLAADRKSVENRGFGVAVRKVQCHQGEDGTIRVSSVETMHERRYTVDDWRYDTAHCEQTENGQKG